MRRLWSLRTSELLAGLSDDQLARLDSLTEERYVKRGQAVFGLGERADCLFVVDDGSVELTVPLRLMGEIRDVTIEGLGPGRALAWSALVPPHFLTMSARAARDTTLIGLPAAKLRALFAAEPRIAVALLGNVARVIGSRLLETQALLVRELQRNVGLMYGARGPAVAKDGR